MTDTAVKKRPDKRQRTCLVGVRLLPAEAEQVRSIAVSLGVSVPEVIRRALLRELREGHEVAS